MGNAVSSAVSLRTELLEACASGNGVKARQLIRDGAEVNCADKDCWTPLHLASTNGHVDLVRLLLEHGADFNRADKDGKTPLHAALSARFSSEGHVDIVQLLSDRKRKRKREMDLMDFLDHWGAPNLFDWLTNVGVMTIEDLSFIEDRQLMDRGMKQVPARKMLQAAAKAAEATASA